MFKGLYRSVAQLVEQRSPKPQVGGSSPSWPANIQPINKTKAFTIYN